MVLFGAIAICGCGLDLWTKHAVFRWLGLPQPGRDHTWWLIEPYVGIQTAVNQGALFGLGQGFSLWFAALSIVAATGIVLWLFVRGGARDRWLTVALAGVMGGIFGNLYDRLGFWHDDSIAAHFRNGVRDWILFQHPRLGTWPNFNIADSLLVCGAAMLMIHALMHRDERSDGETEQDASGAPRD